ncbi:hypothetical protein IV203_031885 [Nitzschia inconspicua]|uniref:Uncharacterized protein n=1 Tax=Nitzschia inconspicua TaxID=303405 RepID=A0A9K3LW18_9STRA|nr:hypothetical protein IV203_031885 [Nitzschia inconspicua]
MKFSRLTASVPKLLLRALTTTEHGAITPITRQAASTRWFGSKSFSGLSLYRLSSASHPEAAVYGSRKYSRRVELHETISILRPQWWHLSPCLGAALQCSPFKNNLIRLAQSIKETERIELEASGSGKDMQGDKTETLHSPLQGPCNLVQKLFFQPQPGAPIRLTKSKSMAAAYLTPQIMGTLMGAALLPNYILSEDDFQHLLLHRHAIKSNRVEGQWTGVSLTRWKELMLHLKVIRNLQSTSTTISEHDKMEALLTAAVWSMAVWERCESKQCILDYTLAIQEVSGLPMLNSANNYVSSGLQSDSVIQRAWATARCDKDEARKKMEGGDDGTSSLMIQPSLQALLSLLSEKDGISEQPDSNESYIEIARSIEHLCRSVLSQQQSEHVKPTTPNGYYGFDGGKLKPDCVEVAVRELIDYLLWDDQSAQFDVSRLPSTCCHELVAFYRSHCANEGGEKWFEMMSDIPGCLYLTSSPSGRQYELTPTLRNVAKVCRRLLYNEGSRLRPVLNDLDWESLSTLQQEWQHKDMQISFDVFTEKAKMSSDIHVHEVALVSRKGKKNAIEMRLRCDWTRNTGFATVTHIQLKKESIDEVLLSQFSETVAWRDPIKDLTSLLIVPLLADVGVLQDRFGGNVSELAFALLACRYGIDRRQMLPITATSDLEREEAAFVKAQRESDKVLISAIGKVCRFISENHDPNTQDTGTILLHWLLSESSQINHAEQKKRTYTVSLETERSILTLPDTVKRRESTKRRIATNWAIRGQLLRNYLDWRSGKASLLMTLSKLKLLDWAGFVLLNWRLR